MKSSRVVKPRTLVERRNLRKVLIIEIKLGVVQVLERTIRVVTLGNDGDPTLRSPTKQDFCRSARVLLGDGSDDVVFEERGSLESESVVDLEEGLGTEGRVASHLEGRREVLGELNEGGLGEKGVVLDLEDGGLQE